MLEPLLGSVNRERVLMYLFARREGYAREIARVFEAGLDPIQKQLDRLEQGGVLISRPAGRTILFSFNPRYAFRRQLENLLKRALSSSPDELRASLVMNRRRPGK